MKAEQFFHALYGTPDKSIAFQGIEEPKPADRKAGIVGPFFGTWEEIKPQMAKVNTKWGVFFCPNDTENCSLLDEHVKRAYCHYIDIDNAPLPDYYPLEPSAIISRDDLHHHVYWFLDTPVDDLSRWEAVQRILIGFYGSDNTHYGFYPMLITFLFPN